MQIEEEKVKPVMDFSLQRPKIIEDGECSHEINSVFSFQ